MSVEALARNRDVAGVAALVILPVLVVTALVGCVATAVSVARKSPDYVVLCSNALRGEDYPVAVEYARMEIEHFPSNAAGHNCMGLAELALGRDEDAERAFDECLRLEPDSTRCAEGKQQASAWREE